MPVAISLYNNTNSIQDSIPSPIPNQATQEMEEPLIWMLMAISLYKNSIPSPIPQATQEMEEPLILMLVAISLYKQTLSLTPLPGQGTQKMEEPLI